MTVSSLPPARVLLMGMMGAGKTTVGAALSRRTGWPYLDNDELVRRGAGIDTRGVLDQRGVGALRFVERQALSAALIAEPPVIAAVAGGIVEDDADLERLRTGGYVVWLRAALDTLVARVGPGLDRPWLQPDPRTALAALYAGRAERYARAASLAVDVDALSPEEIAERIVAGLRGRAGGASGRAVSRGRVAPDE